MGINRFERPYTTVHLPCQYGGCTAQYCQTFILEDLLRCCPGIQSIYILLRQKKNISPDSRKEPLFKKKIFSKIKEENPEVLNKVFVVAGDISLPNLGLNKEDELRIIEEVSIIFHCAASISFFKPARYLVSQNVLSTKCMITLCRQLKKLDVFVYTSTAFCNSNHRTMETMPEEVLRLPFPVQKFIDALKNETENTFEELVAECKPDWPNWYSFSKVMAENLIVETASDLPVAIVRPSVVFCSWKTPLRGYVEGQFGITALVCGGAQGFIKVYFGDPDIQLNIIPVDVVANAHLIVAWSVGTSRAPTPFIVNCVSNENLNPRAREILDCIMELSNRYPAPRTFQMTTWAAFIRNPTIYWLLSVYEHYVPAYFFDFTRKISGKKPRMVDLYRYIDKIEDSLYHFTTNEFKYDCSNMLYLNRLLHPDDKKVLDVDSKELTFRDLMMSLPEAAPFYDWKEDKKSPQSRLKFSKQVYWMIQVIKGSFLMICFMLVYWIFSFVL
ncbi:fatty acyl-CoA reductase 1 [Trichonephila clavata]|uniref:Fatty acyl-CoA reductase n=1 Tax=Trichonephila clavata TaxID=2740835 RepID=A0A8X6GF18_TRICU|nr:fatty acyl-CoA reductase 1 [Trichonephila clavata]